MGVVGECDGGEVVPAPRQEHEIRIGETAVLARQVKRAIKLLRTGQMWKKKKERRTKR
jgi:hypothetical protein